MTLDAKSLRHELRTPVNHVLGYADLLLEEDEIGAGLRAALGGVRESAQRVLPMITGLLDADEDVSQATVVALDTVVTQLMHQARALPPEGAHAADLDRIRTASERLGELVAALQREREPRAVSVGEDRAAEGPAPGHETAPTVLVVDDDEANRNVLSRRLFRLGYSVVEASNGREALDVLANSAIDLMLLDVMMPEMDGHEVLERRRASPALRDIPVIMISALDEPEVAIRCIEHGAEDYLPKPFDPVLLQARVGACIEKKRLRDQEKQLLETVTRQSEELRAWNLQLERRVAEKVREVEKLSLMQRFVPPQLAEVIESGGAELLKSHRREITVLFCDLRGFTPFSETAEPEDVMSVLAELHEAVGPSIFELGGTLAQFTGDGMMVFFNDPVPCDEPAWRAVQLAMAMRDRAEGLSESWRRHGHELRLGVGIAVGYATCGQIGFQGRYEYTAIGTVTNLASRLCAEAAGGQVLVSGRVVALVDGRVNAEPIGELTLKGFARPVPAYAITTLTAAD
ncbi:MAG: response regulator [Dehalococcoidia bacterium]